jgi:hypothetical protein
MRLVAAMAVIAALFGLVASCASSTPEQPGAATLERRSSTLPSGSASTTVQAGYKLVSYRDIELAVPKSLTVTHSPCFPPVNAVYAPTDAAYSCPSPAPKGHKKSPPSTATGVWLDERPYDAISTTREPTGQLTVADVHVVVRAPARAQVHAILTSVRAITVDYLGCPTHPASITPRGQPPATELVPHGSTSAVLCELAPIGPDHSYWLVGSLRLGAAAAADLAAVLDALPPGAGKSGYGALPDYVWARFGYASDAIRVVAVPTNYEPAYISDGRRTVVDTRPGVDGLLSLLHQD